ncbi:MAG: hypothetical protein LUG93_11635 [Lachnospiraceae bacterium]|nr:hypothetical protein [Lachnospiraceae bacterium]
MPGKRIAYIGIDLLYPALPALIEAGCEIMEVITCETDNVTEFNVQVCECAKKRGIPLFIGKISAERLSVLRERGCEAVVCGGYYYRIPVVEGLKMVNIHPSLLPVGRGAWPMPVTILKGLRESGVTVHRMTEGFDEGAILLQEEIPVSPKENLLTLTKKQKAVLPGMMRRLAEDFDTLYEQAKPQGDGEYWSCPSEEDYPLTPDTPFEEADRILRAFYGYECVYEADGVRYGLIEGVAGKNSVSSTGGVSEKSGVDSTGAVAEKSRAGLTGAVAEKNSVSSIGTVAEKSETGKEMPGEFPLRDGRIRTGRCRIINGKPRHAELPAAMPWPASRICSANP